MQGAANRRPGIVNWLTKLQDEECLEMDRLSRFAAVSVLYDSSGSSVTNTVSDSLSFHADLLTEAGYVWQKRIVEQVHLTDSLADAVGLLAGELAAVLARQTVFCHRRRKAGAAKQKNASSEKDACRRNGKNTVLFSH